MPFFRLFGGEQGNPAWDVVKRLPDRIAGAELIKLAEARIPDNNGNQPVDGPDAYFSTLPVKAMVQSIRARGIPLSGFLQRGHLLLKKLPLFQTLEQWELL